MIRLTILLIAMTTTLTGCSTMDTPRAMTLGRALAPEPTVIPSAVLTVGEIGTGTVIHANGQSE
jgi:hypothetical protein